MWVALSAAVTAGAVAAARAHAERAAAPVLLAYTHGAPVRAAARCTCCGSHESRAHRGANVCAYCRTPAAGRLAG